MQAAGIETKLHAFAVSHGRELVPAAGPELDLEGFARASIELIQLAQQLGTLAHSAVTCRSSTGQVVTPPKDDGPKLGAKTCCNLLQYGDQCGYTGIVVEYERKRVKLGKTGGSPSVVLPKAWVDGLVGGSEVDLVRTEHRIVIEAPRQAPEPDFENEPAFGAFLGLLLQETITQRPLAKETADLLARSARLTAGVKLGHD